MKKVSLSGFLIVCLALLQARGEPATAERYYVVRIADIDGKENYQVLTAEALKTLTDETRAEAAFFLRAVENVRVLWTRDADLRHTIFPKASLSAPKADTIGTGSPDHAKALKKIESLAEAEKAQEKRKQDRETERNKGRPAPKSNDTKTESKNELDKRAALAKAVIMVRAEIDKMKEAAAAKASSDPSPKPRR